MKSRKGFTLIELMVVILIVSILAAVAIPIMRGRIDAAKWSEGRAMMGTIGTCIRAYCAEHDQAPSTGDFTSWGTELGFVQGDFQGAYFTYAAFNIDGVVYDPNILESPLTFTIKGTKTELTPDSYTLTATGTWTAGTGG